MIKSDNDEYFIEPLERGKQMEEEKGRIHVVYKRSAVERAPIDMSQDFHYRGTHLWQASIINYSSKIWWKQLSHQLRECDSRAPLYNVEEAKEAYIYKLWHMACHL